MVTLFLEKEENNINVMAVALYLNIGNTGKIENIFFNEPEYFQTTKLLNFFKLEKPALRLLKDH